MFQQKVFLTKNIVLFNHPYRTVFSFLRPATPVVWALTLFSLFVTSAAALAVARAEEKVLQGRDSNSI